MKTTCIIFSDEVILLNNAFSATAGFFKLALAAGMTTSCISFGTSLKYVE